MKPLIIGSGKLGMRIAQLFDYATVTTTKIPKEVSCSENIEVAQYYSGSQTESFNSQKVLNQLVQNHDLIFVVVSPNKAKLGGLSFDENFYRVFNTTYDQTTKEIASAIKHNEHAKVIYIGAHTVYGNSATPVNEKSELYPVHKCAEALIKAEENIKMCPNHLILRLGWVVRTEEHWKNFVSAMSQAYKFPGDGSARGNFIHEEDIFGAIQFLLNKNAEGIYNVVNDCHLKWSVLFDRISEKYHIDTIKWDPEMENKWFEGDHIAENSKIKHEGYQFTRPNYCGIDEN